MVIGRREFKIVMSLDDQTSREREKLNQSLGNTHRASKKMKDEANQSIVEIAKSSKQHMEGIKAVLELGGWLMMARQVGKAFMDITAEARKNSTAFKEAGAALDVMKGQIGSSLVKALEPVAKGFTSLLTYGTAVFKNFPEVAKATFDFVGAIIKKTFTWDGIKNLFVTIGEGIITIFRASFEYIPKLFTQMIQLLLNPIYRFGEYVAEVLAKAFALKFDEIETPGSFMARIATEQTEKMGEIVKGAKDYVMTQAANVKAAAANVAELYAPEGKEYAKRLNGILAPDIAEFQKATSEQVKKNEGTTTGTGVLDSWQMKLMQQTEDRLKILDLERIQALASLQEQLKDTEQLRQAEALVNQYYDAETLKAKKDAANEALKTEIQKNAAIAAADAEARKLALEAARSSAEQARSSNLQGKNGLGAAVRENLSGTEVMSPAGDLLTSIFSKLGAFLPSVSNLIALLNPLQTIMSAAFEVLEPLLNNLLAPLVGILKIIGYTIGKLLAPALEILRPIIEAIATLFVWVYNKIIVPIYNGIMYVFNMIYNGFAAFVNAILEIVDAIPFVDVGRVSYRSADQGFLSEISLDTVASAGSTSSSGGSASYSAGTSVVIESLEINVGVVAGDEAMDDFSLMVRDHIAELSGLGR